MESLWYHLVQILFQFLKLSVFFAAIVLPATWVAVRRLAGISIVARIGLGAAVGFGLFVIGTWYVGLWSFEYGIVFWLVQFPIAAWLGRFSESNRHKLVESARGAGWSRHAGCEGSIATRLAKVDESGGATAPSWMIVLPLVGGLLLQLYALQFSELPHGVDSAFHCVVALHLAEVGHVTADLWPLESVKLNYPLGSHMWLAVASDWTGLPLHTVFSQSFSIALFGAGLIVAAWAERLFGSPRFGVGAAFAFVFCNFQASLYPYTWGGLPSLMAMWLGMSALFSAAYLSGFAGLAVSALLFAATAMVHHHTMVAMLGGAGMVSAFGWILSRQSRDAWRRVLLAIIGGSAIASVYMIPLATRVSDLGRMGILRFTEPFAWPWEHLWSWKGDEFIRTLTLLCAAVTVIGMVIGFVVATVPSLRMSRALLISLAAVWLFAFCSLDYGGRLVAHATNRPSIQPFTPSRFLFDAHFILAIFVGAGLERIWTWLRRPAFRYALVAVLACGAVGQIEPRWHAVADDALIPLGRWADKTLPHDALISGSPSVWVTYTFHRESTSLFVPVSEPVDFGRSRMKKTLLLRPETQPWSLWRQSLQKPIYIISYANSESDALAPLYSVGRYAIYDVNGL